jgi:hypothetical protein
MRGMGQGPGGNGGLGPLTPYHPPNIEQLQTYNVNRAGQPEVIWQPLYDYQTYAMAGATQMTFFQRSVGSSGTTYADTNMTVGGMLPRPQEFLITGIQVYFKPAGAVNRSALAAATVLENWNDINDVIFASNFLKLFIGSKDYLTDGPLGKFPPVFGISGAAAYMGTTTADMNGRATDYAKATGRYYSITPVKIPANQNFNVSLNWPTAAAAAAAGLIGVILDGFLYRLSQ